MIYVKYTFKVKENTSSLEVETLFDILSSTLSDYGFETFENEDIHLKAFITEDNNKSFDINKALESYPITGVTFSYDTEIIPDVNWNEEWEKNYFSAQIFAGGRCVVRAPFHPRNESADIELIISPKMAFGTGNHQTTALMIEYIMSIDVKNKSVLDMGCGTGILGMLTLKNGAKSLTSVDVDKWAYENVLENFVLNNIEKAEVIQGDALSLSGLSGFDLIFANITRNILFEDMPKYVEVMNDNAILVLSGFYVEDVAMLIDRGASLGLTHRRTNIRDNWALIELSKSK